MHDNQDDSEPAADVDITAEGILLSSRESGTDGGTAEGSVPVDSDQSRGKSVVFKEQEAAVPPPMAGHTVLTTKEASVLRERQRQIERELACIKQQLVQGSGGSLSDHHPNGTSATGEAPPRVYGSIEEGNPSRELSALESRRGQESTPLLRMDPPEIITTVAHRQEQWQRRVFSDVRSEEESEREEVHNESEHYLKSSMFARAIPERLFALTVTMIFEIPVLLMISGGSDALCTLIGRSRYQLLIGFLPLTSAISGNVGLQASTLTTRAISHIHVTADSYVPWLLTEIGAAAYLGTGMGITLGFIAFVASGMDMAFGLTIGIAQFLSIVTAGCTGTIAPLLFSFIFKRDSGKWGGPLETAIQDIVGSFAMVVVSYHVLKFLGPGPIDPNDVCGAGDGGTF